ncbi:MAG TPA: hypothetical protein VMS17_06560, partial [Gemmataceae bacterium]|nr:hypothetical protein [Gemmataceae bacterium]
MRTLVAAVATLLTLALVADAQSSRRGREDPELVVENGYRTGACDDLRFTPDGKRLLAIGDDKVVRVWSFADGKIDPQSVRVLRWGIWREQRGAIYAMDISADGKRVVIGGLGAANSMVALLDLDSGEMLDSAVAPNDATGNVSAYWAAAFAPSGQRAVFGAGDGSVWLWDLEKHAFRRLGKPESNAPFNTVRLVRFEDESHVLSVSEDGSLLRWTLGRDDPDLVKKLGFTVFKAEISPDGKWLAAAAKGPLVTIRSLVDETEFRDIKLKGFETFHPGQKDGEYANALAFDPKSSRLAVAVGSFVPGSSFAIDGDDRIVFCDFSQKQAKETLSLEHSYKAERLTFHPSGGYFAAAGGDNQEVTLWDLAHTAEPATVLSGPARCLWDAALSVDGAVGFRDQRNPNSVNPDERARGPWRAFDPASRQWLAANDFKPVPRLTSLLGWTVQPAGNDPHVWYAVHESGARNKLTINGDLYGKPRCWTFLPPVNNGPVRLAVGHYWGFSVFELDPAAKEARRTRLCVGHQGEVTALGPSADGKQLVSCSTDMTLAFWDVTKSWPSQAILGAKFAPKDDRLVVTAADAGSPAWEAGLLVDDEIVQVGVGAGWVEGGPAAWLKQLEDPTPGAVYGFDVVRNGRNITAAGRQPLTTSLKQRPLWRFYPAGGDEWVLWMWRN